VPGSRGEHLDCTNRHLGVISQLEGVGECSFRVAILSEVAKQPQRIPDAGLNGVRVSQALQHRRLFQRIPFGEPLRPEHLCIDETRRAVKNQFRNYLACSR
jgi:hypothetical protein